MVFLWFVGIDWAAEKYDVCVLDARGKVVARRVIKHSGSAIAELLDWLQEIAGGKPGVVAVAIETPPAQLDSAQRLRLRELSRIQEELQVQENRLSNQLWEQLHRYYPQTLTLCPGANEEWLWELIEMAPLPWEAPKLKLVAVQRLLGSHRIRGVKAEEVLEILN
jgi:hypothetical protein